MIRLPHFEAQGGQLQGCRLSAALPEAGERRVSEGFFSPSLLTRATLWLTERERVWGGEAEPSGPRRTLWLTGARVQAEHGRRDGAKPMERLEKPEPRPPH